MDPKKEEKLHREKLLAKLDKEWYTIRSILGCSNWALFYCLLGGREAGKSYSVMYYMINQWKKYGTPFVWLRLTEASSKKLLKNNASDFVDPDIARHFNLKLKVKGTTVYDNNKPMARILAISTFYTDKGVAFFDNEYKGRYNICLDEMNREKGERNSFDITYSLVNEAENLIRSRKENIRFFLIGNTLEEASDIMVCFGFIPETFGRYKLKKKRCVIDYMQPSKKYLDRRKGSVADLLAPEESTFTNKIDVDRSLIDKRRLKSVSYIIKFSVKKEDWYCVYDSVVVKSYNGETCKNVVAMSPYIDGTLYDTTSSSAIFQLFDKRALHFRDLITQKRFKKALELLKPRKS